MTVTSAVKLSYFSKFRDFLILCFVSFQIGLVASVMLISLCVRRATAIDLRAVATAPFFIGDTSENFVSTLLNALMLTMTALDSNIMLITLVDVVL